ncbi:MAG: hypothetical protein WBP64_15280 [Nitrososphaeraceae archaeon]
MHKISDAREIEQEKTKPYFKQEYCRFYDFDTRNLFTTTTLDAIEHLAQIDASYDTELDTFIDRIYMLLKDEEEEK